MVGVETPVLFDCRGEKLLGICHQPQSAGRTGVVVVVGGPQYRVGSHRQFVLLARYLAAHDVPVFRFDYRGMGDSSGVMVDFEEITPDIKAAIDRFFQLSPQLEQVVLWGLCDAASAIMIYARENDQRVAGQILLNAWMRTEEGIARVYLKNYYTRRLLERGLWRKVMRGQFNVGKALSDMISVVKKTWRKSPSGRQEHYTDRMLEGMQAFAGRSLFILSGNDFTADEFRQVAAESADWQALTGSPRVETRTLPAADHTFSRAEWRNQVAEWSVKWLKTL